MSTTPSILRSEGPGKVSILGGFTSQLGQKPSRSQFSASVVSPPAIPPHNLSPSGLFPSLSPTSS